MDDAPTDTSPEGGRALRLLDRAIEVQQPSIAAHIAKLRDRHPQKSRQELWRLLEKQYLAAVTGSGAAVGAAAAAPGVGTAASLAMSAGETAVSFEAMTLFALSVAELHGVRLVETERIRTLLLSLLLGESGGTVVAQTAGRTGARWAKQIVSSIPMSQIAKINRILGRKFVTRYGTRQGLLVLGRAIPFGLGAGIGAAGNAAVGRGVVKGVRRAFGELPADPSPDTVVSTPEGPVR